MPGRDRNKNHRHIIAVGASGGGGLLDMAQLLALFPAGFPGTILLTLHRPSDRPSNLAAILQRVSPLKVAVARQAELLRPGTCYVGEPDAHLTLSTGSTIRLIADPRRVYRNRTIDLLFRSVATHAAEHAIGVVLSGGLADGSDGLAEIRRAGGAGMARHPAASFEGDMPRNAIAAARPLQCIDHVPGLARAIIAQGMGAHSPAPAVPATRRLASLARLQSCYAGSFSA